MDLIGLLSIQILIALSLRDHCVGYLKHLSQYFGYILKKGLGLALPGESNALRGVGGRLELSLQVGRGH
jgi:hypothetical protein